MDTIKELKKYDLHCHLDGSLSAVTIRKLAAEIGKELPNDKKLAELLQVEPGCTSLKEYLMKFDLPLSCLITKESFRTAVRELLHDAAQENVVYMEIRFAPLLSVHDNLTMREIIEGAIDGMEEGKKLYHVDSSLILCGMRHMSVEDNIRVVKEAREFLGAGVCAVDLAGDEAGFPVMGQKEMFETARKLDIPFTIHAGECGSAQSVRDALELGASRIGHGIAVKKDAQLMKYCAQHNICLEMCPTSNLQTKAVDSMEEYPFMEFLEAGIPVTVNTDNRTVSNTSITKELELLKEYYHLAVGDIEKLMENARMAALDRGLWL